MTLSSLSRERWSTPSGAGNPCSPSATSTGAIGPYDCATTRAKAASFTAAVDARWPAGLPLVQISLDVTRNSMAFTDAATGCGLPR